MVNLAFSEEDQKFRADVRAFMDENLPADLRHKVVRGAPISKEEHQHWQRVLSEKGWLAPNWPKQYGGGELDPIKRFIFDEEASIAGAPRANVPAIDLLGPILIAFGTDAQRRRFLPRILTSEDWWCQGFSEPAAGSDLASLQCKAERVGDEYVVNGSKIWTSHAQYADWMFCLVRTSNQGKKQAGISFLLFPMDTPGVSVQPLITLGGVHTVNQVFFDGVRTPVENLVGKEGDGWRITGILLSHERLVGAGLGPSQRLLKHLNALAKTPPFSADEAFQDRLALITTDLIALKYTAYRVLAAEMAGEAPGTEVSVLKLKGAKIQQSLAEMLIEIAGPLAMLEPFSAGANSAHLNDDYLLHAATTYFDLRKLSIYGGSNEIQRNIISRRILNL